MKANELTPEYIADYLKIDDPEESDFKDIEIFHSAAIGYIKIRLALMIRRSTQVMI